jgi:hypothetical protein
MPAKLAVVEREAKDRHHPLVVGQAIEKRRLQSVL